MAKKNTVRMESDSLGKVEVPADKLWGAQTQRSLTYFSIGDDRIPKEMVTAYAILKKAAALTNKESGLLPDSIAKLVIRVCDEILDGQHADMFPLFAWMTGSGTQFNMNVNEVIANRCAQLTGNPLGCKKPVHPNDHVNMSQSSNDTFPSAMHIAAAVGVRKQLIPALKELRNGLHRKSMLWKEVIKIGRTHMQDATPMTVGQELSGYVQMLDDDEVRLDQAVEGLYPLALGGTAIGTGINTTAEFGKNATKKIAAFTSIPFVSAANKFAVQGAHDALVQLSGTIKTLAVSLYKIGNDIRFLSCGPRAGIYEFILPTNEPGSSIMPGKINPTQCEALTMVAGQAIANDLAVTLGGAGGNLEMNVHKPQIILNIMKNIHMLSDAMRNFQKYLVEGLELNRKKIEKDVQRSLMLVTALDPIIGYDRSAKIALHAYHKDLSLREAALELGYISAEAFDKAMDIRKMVEPHKNRKDAQKNKKK